MTNLRFVMLVGLAAAALGACQTPPDGEQELSEGELTALCKAKGAHCLKEGWECRPNKSKTNVSCVLAPVLVDPAVVDPTCEAENPCDCKVKCDASQVCEPKGMKALCITPDDEEIGEPGPAPGGPNPPDDGSGPSPKPPQSVPNLCVAGEVPEDADTRRPAPPKPPKPPKESAPQQPEPEPTEGDEPEPTEGEEPQEDVVACFCEKTPAARSTCAGCDPKVCAKDGKVCGISAETLMVACVAKPGDAKPPMAAPAPVPCSTKVDAHKALCDKCKPTCTAPGKACTVAVDADGKLPAEAKCTTEQKPPTGGPDEPPAGPAPGSKQLDCKDLPPSVLASTLPADLNVVMACKVCKTSECGKKPGAVCKLLLDDKGKVVPGPAMCTSPMG